MLFRSPTPTPMEPPRHAPQVRLASLVTHAVNSWSAGGEVGAPIIGELSLCTAPWHNPARSVKQGIGHCFTVAYRGIQHLTVTYRAKGAQLAASLRFRVDIDHLPHHLRLLLLLPGSPIAVKARRTLPPVQLRSLLACILLVCHRCIQ